VQIGSWICLSGLRMLQNCGIKQARDRAVAILVSVLVSLLLISTLFMEDIIQF